MTQKSTVYFIGAGPGDPELLTLKAHRLLSQADALFFAGSLIPKELFLTCRKDALFVDTASLTLEEICSGMYACAQKGHLICRVHAGDPSLYGALREESTFLEEKGIAWEVVAGISAANAAAAFAKISFTVPTVTQTLILTRMSGKTPLPPSEDMDLLACHHSSMAVYLSGKLALPLQQKLLKGGYPPSTPVFCAHKMGLPEEKGIWCSLESLAECVEKNHMESHTIFLILPAEVCKGKPSFLYDAHFSHSFRQGS